MRSVELFISFLNLSPPTSTPNCACTKITYYDGGTHLVFDEVIPY